MTTDAIELAHDIDYLGTDCSKDVNADCLTLARALLAMAAERDELNTLAEAAGNQLSMLNRTLVDRDRAEMAALQERGVPIEGDTFASLLAERDELRRERDDWKASSMAAADRCIRIAEERDLAWQDRDAEVQTKLRLCAAIRAEHEAHRDRLKAALVEACEIAARLVADSQALPSTDSARIAALRQIGEGEE